MDIYDRLTRMLAPIGGQLVVDSFMDEAERGRRAQREEQRARDENLRAREELRARHEELRTREEMRTQHEELPQEVKELIAAAAAAVEVEPTAQDTAPAQSSDDLSDSGRLRLEVMEFMSGKNKEEGARDEIQEFMSRDNNEEAGDDEIQEFLKEHSGFDPTEG